MTEKQVMQAFVEFNSVYFDGKLTCELTIIGDWIDNKGNYHPDSAVIVEIGDLNEGSCDGVKVRRASGLYTYPPKNLISIPKWKTSGEKATQGVLLHEMAHAAANEPGIDHGPKWYTEMHRLWKKGAPINLHDVTPGYSEYPLVEQYGIGSEFWKNLG